MRKCPVIDLSVSVVTPLFISEPKYASIKLLLDGMVRLWRNHIDNWASMWRTYANVQRNWNTIDTNTWTSASASASEPISICIFKASKQATVKSWPKQRFKWIAQKFNTTKAMGAARWRSRSKLCASQPNPFNPSEDTAERRKYTIHNISPPHNDKEYTWC